MSKILEINNETKLKQLIKAVLKSVQLSSNQIRDVKGDLELFTMMKFGGIGCDPLQPNRGLNLIEQINQSFTYLASFKATQILFQEHPKEAPFRLNLGTASGSDIESISGNVAAEVFASVTPTNNQKLKKDISKVANTNATLKYAFFMSPNYKSGHKPELDSQGVKVWAVEL